MSLCLCPEFNKPDLITLKNKKQKDMKAKGINFGEVFSILPDPFTVTDLRVQCRNSFLQSPVKQIIMLWRKNKLISKVDVDKFKKN